MAKAGDRYEERTGNIWSYAKRGDLTGLKTALTRGVHVNLRNTVGWTAAHAAAAGGQTKALRMLARAGADLGLQDRGGKLPVHEAAKNGHLKALEVLGELGADVTRVRLSQAKGLAVRKFLCGALRKAGVQEEELSEGMQEVVGYARKQSKSTAFWGPRRTPISGKIKKKILKQKRLRKQAWEECEAEAEVADEDDGNGAEAGGWRRADEPEFGFKASVQQVKRNSRRGRQQRRARAQTRPQSPEAKESERLEDIGGGQDSGSDLDGPDEPLQSPGRFAALAFGERDSDSHSESPGSSGGGGAGSSDDPELPLAPAAARVS